MARRRSSWRPKAGRARLPGLDLQLPGSSGLELQRELADGDGPPIIFITGHGDIPSSVRAMKAGAIEFLPKPFAIRNCCRRSTRRLRSIEKDGGAAELAELQKHYALPHPCAERKCCPSWRPVWANKQTVAELGHERDHHRRSSRPDHAQKWVRDRWPNWSRMADKLSPTPEQDTPK